MRSIRSSLLEFDPRRRRQSRASTTVASKPAKRIVSRPRPEDPVVLSPVSPRKIKSLHARTFGNKHESKEGDAKADNGSQRRGRRSSVPLPTLLTSRRGRSRSKAAPKDRSKSVTASTPASPAATPKTVASKRAKSSGAPKKQRSRSSRRYNYNSCYRGHERLHLVLARRSKPELLALLEELQRQTEAPGPMSAEASSSNQPIPITTVCVYADSPLFCAHNHRHYSQTQTRLLLQQVGVSFGRNLQHLQLDFSSEFGSHHGASAGLPLLTTTLPHTALDNNGDAAPNRHGSCILDCHLVASMLRQAPHLESLLLKEVVLEGDAQELRDALLHPLATTATPYSSKSSLAKVELKWCSSVDNNSNSNNIMSTLLATLAEMPHLQELVVLVFHSHGLHDILPRLATSPSITKLTLGLEQRILANDMDATLPASRPSAKDLRQQEQTMLLDLLQLLHTKDGSWISPLQELHLFSHHWTKSTAPQYIHALANLLGGESYGGPSLQTLVWVDYNYGTFQNTGTADTHSSVDAPGSDGTSLMPLVAALKANPNSRLRHFKVVTKQRRPENSRQQRASASMAFAAALKECLETHASLQSVEIIHAGVSMNFPSTRVATATQGNDISLNGDDGTIGTWSQQHQHHYGNYSRSIVAHGRNIGLQRSKSNTCTQRSFHIPCNACGAMLASNPVGTSCTDEKHLFQYNKTMIAFLLMTNQLQARQRFWLTPLSPSEDKNNSSKGKETNEKECTLSAKGPTTATAYNRDAWVTFLSEHHDNTPLLYFLLRDNPTLIVDSAAAAAATAAAKAAADRLAYAKLRSKSAGRRRRGDHSSTGKSTKGEEPIWESYF